MSEPASNQLNSEERLARLERAVYWHKVGWIIVLTIAIAYLIPPLGGIIGLALFVSLIAGSVIVFITSVICILDRILPDTRPKS